MNYTNPILLGDYSDPDVIRVGDAFYLISSSFTYVPGIPVLKSTDLVHWRTIGYAAERLPFARYDQPQHKCGTWAPSIRHHNGRFYVYACMPDEGLFAFTAENPEGPWECHHVKDVVGWIDPCPLFDTDGKAWLIHGFAASRSGINNVLYLHEMSPDGLSILDKGRPVYDGAAHGDETVEGPKIYRRNGTYWILCPAGGVPTGYQLALRSESLFGPYERRVVLQQGESPVNGPHQGGWVEDGQGGDWFIHFQDQGVYGRVTHLQRVDWSDGWPMMGDCGTPELVGSTNLKQDTGAPCMSDDFANGLGLQWQWQANPNPGWWRTEPGRLNLYAAPAGDLFHAGNFLSQLMQAWDFTMDVSLRLHPLAGDRAGVAMMGYTYHYLALDGLQAVLVRGEAQEINRWTETRVRETVLEAIPWPSTSAKIRMSVRDGRCAFFLWDSGIWLPIGQECEMANGGWTSARPGVFAMNTLGTWGGHAVITEVEVRRLSDGARI